MKTNPIIAAAALALGLLPAAFAATPVLHIAGAATYRPPVQKAIEDILNTGYTFGYNGSGRYKPNASIYSGTLRSNNQPVIIETYWTGDLAGVVDLAQQNTITKWIRSDAATLAALTTSGIVIANGYATESSPPQVAVTVSFSSSSAAAVSTAIGGAAAANAINSATFVDAGTDAANAGAVGIAPFVWVLGRLASGAAPFTSISQAQAYSLIQGPTPLAFFTGASADKNKYVFLAGRSEDSGARTVPLAEAQTGFGQNVQQFQLTFSNNQTTQSVDGLPTGGAGSTITGLYLWPGNSPLNTLPGINWKTPGHSGYNLTSDLANVLSASNPVTGLTIGNAQNPTPIPSGYAAGYFVGYVGPADAAGIIGGTILSYNGVPYSTAAVQSGQYSLWSFAHIYYLGSGANPLGGQLKTAADNLADKIFLVDAPTNSNGVTTAGQANAAGILFDSSVLVTRGVEGGQISQTY